MLAARKNRFRDAAGRFDAVRTRCELWLEEAKELLRDALATAAPAADRLDARVLEPRILLSATPMPSLAPVSLAAEPDALLLPSSGDAAADSVMTLQMADEAPQRPHSTGRLEWVIIDSRVADAPRWVEDLTAQDSAQRQFEILVLDADRDGIDQITEALSQRSDIDAVHFVSHGSAGRIALGSTWLSLDNAAEHADRLTAWGDALSDQADLMFYGCDLAGNTDGASLMDAIGRWTGADVAASDDVTGHATLGGDWLLEYRTGIVETVLAPSTSMQQQWLATLDVLTFQNGVDGYSGTLDTELHGGDADDSYGSATDLELDRDPNRHALIQFQNIFGGGANQIPLGSTIHSATLTVEVTGTSEATAQIELFRMLTAWSESDTYNTLAAGIQRNDFEASSTRDSMLANPAGNNAQSFTGLAAAVQAWADGDANHGWVIFSDSDSAWKFRSSEEGDVTRRPTLTVDFTAPVVPQQLYWADPSGGKIVRSNLDGSSVEDVITGVAGVKDVVVDAATQKLYWTRSSAGVIQSANLDGSGVQTLLSGLTSPQGLAIDAADQRVYWAEDGLLSGQVRRAALDGSNVETLVNSGLGSMDDVILDVGAGKVYWIDSGSGRIQRTDLHGASVETIATSPNTPYGLQLDAAAGFVYWGNDDLLGLSDAIYRADLAGSAQTAILTSGVDAPSGLALDLAAGKIYWAESSLNKIRVADLDGTNIQDVLTGLGSITAVALGPGDQQTPHDIALAGTVVAENVLGANFGNLTVTDPDVGDTHVWSFSDSRFRISGGKLKLDGGVALDFETEPTINLTITATDQGGAGSSYSETFLLTVTNVNEAPTDITLSGATVAENVVAAAIGNIAVSDPDAGDTHTWSVSDSRFEVVGGQLKLKAGQSLDHESEPTVGITLTATDQAGAGLSYSETFVISVADVNEAPTAITLSGATLAESAMAAAIGNVAVSDPDAGDTHTWSVSDSRFEVVGGQLKLKAGQSLDHESEPTVGITLTATDQSGAGLSHSETFVITVADMNEAPTAITLSDTTVAENVVAAAIGNLAVADPDAGDTHTWTVSDSRFEVVGGQLKLKAGQSLDHESVPTVSVTLVATDQSGAGLSFGETFVISVTDLNESPTGITLSGTALAENAVAAAIGNLNVTDPDAGNIHAWTVSDSRFEVVGGQLKLKPGQSLDHESEPTVNITLTATDQSGAGLSYSETFVISVADVNEAPTAITLSDTTLAENAVAAAIGNVIVADADAGDTHTWSVSDSRFEVVGGQLKLKAGQSLDYESEPIVGVTLTATDQAGAGLSFNETFVISVADVNEAPTAITLSGTALAENAVAAAIGNVIVADADAGDTHTLTVSDSRFEVVGGQLKLKAGQSLDHESEPAVGITLTATDQSGAGLSFSETVMVSVNDIDEPPVTVAANPAVGPDGSVTFVTDEDVVATFSLAGLFADPDGQPLRYVIRSHDPSVAGVQVQGDLLRVRPAVHWYGTTRIMVAARDAGGAEVAREIAIQVRPVNDVPVAVADRVQVGTGRTAEIDLATLLANDFDVDSPHLVVEIVDGPRHGRLVVSTAGTWQYRADASAAPYDRFTYRVYDGAVYSDPVSVSLQIAAPLPVVPTGMTTTPQIKKENSDATTGNDRPAPEAEVVEVRVATAAGHGRLPVAGHKIASIAAGPSGVVQDAIAPTANNPWSAATWTGLSMELGDQGQSGSSSLDRTASHPAPQRVSDNAGAPVSAPGAVQAAVMQPHLWQAIDSMHDELDATFSHTTLTIGATVTATTGMTVGYVVWIVRGGLMLSSLMANLPMWRLMDPLAILNQSSDDEDSQADESLASMVQGEQPNQTGKTPAATDPDAKVQR